MDRGAWQAPWGHKRVRHDWATKQTKTLNAYNYICNLNKFSPLKRVIYVLTNDVATIRHSHDKKNNNDNNNLGTKLTPLTKINWEWIIALNMKCKITKLPEYE